MFGERRILKYSLAALFVLLGLAGIASFLARVVLLEMRGPTAEVAFERYVASPVPTSVKDIRTVFRRFLNGYEIFIYFEAEPADIESIFPLEAFWPTGEIAFSGWPHCEEFAVMENVEPLDLSRARYLRESGEGYCREIVVSDDLRHVYFVHYVHSDLNRE